MRLKDFAAFVACGVMLFTVSSLNCKTVYAEETATVGDAAYSDDTDEFEENISVVGDIKSTPSGRRVHPFYEIKSNKILKCEKVYDDTGKLIKLIEYDNGKKIKSTEYNVYEESDYNVTNTYKYNDSGEVIEYIFDGLKDGNPYSEGIEYKYEYDVNDRKVKQLGYEFYFENGEKIYFDDGKMLYYYTYEYDSNGKCIKIILNDNDECKEFKYDENGNCIKIKKGELIEEYNTNGDFIKNNYGIKYDYDYEYDTDGDLIKVTEYTVLDIGGSSVKLLHNTYEYEYIGALSTSGIYCSRNYPSIQAGINIQKANPDTNVEYRWVACNIKDPEGWFEISPWTGDSNWMDWTPQESGGYVFVCYARIEGKPKTEIQCAFGTEYHKYIKGICQMPYSGEGGGYLIGIESYDNPNNSYQYEMQILDCNLYMQGKDAWVYTTGRCGAEDNCLWTVWQPVYGYYWTLFRVYDSNGKLLDEACYGFENVN